MKQKAFIISSSTGLASLNEYLGSGWKVVHTCPMPSSLALTGSTYVRDSISPTCLVIIEG